MATRYWRGGAALAAQVSTGSIDSVDGTPANNTFTVTIGGISIDAVGDTDVATTATNLRASLNASTHPYFAAITWSGTSGDIIGTADTLGVPFIAALTETGAGTGAVTDFAATTANGSPNDFGNADNWDAQTAPVNSDTIIFADSSIDCVWSLTTGLTGISLYIDKSFTGDIGLDRRSFATASDGGSLDTTVPEYRTHTLSIDASLVVIGRQLTGTSQAGSGRIKIDNIRASASECIIEDTGTASGPAAVMYTAAHANADVEVREAPGGLGLATDVPGATSTFGNLNVAGSNAGTSVSLGAGVTVTNIHMNEGELHLRAAATITLIDHYGGEIYANGDATYTVTTYNAHGGTLDLNGDVDLTTLNIEGGDVDCSKSSQTRTIGTVNFNQPGSLTLGDNLTVSTLNKPTAGTLTYSA